MLVSKGLSSAGKADDTQEPSCKFSSDLIFSKCRDTPPPVTSCIVWKTIPLKIHADKKACGLRQHLLQVKILFENLIVWSLEFGFGVSASHLNLCLFFQGFKSFMSVIKSLATCYFFSATCYLVSVCHRLNAPCHHKTHMTSMFASTKPFSRQFR